MFHESARGENSDTFALEMLGISKEFPGVKALSGVSLQVRPREIRAICGENGAGKSTLMKILAGFYPHSTYDGEIRIFGKPQKFKNMRDSKASGVAVVYQELSLFGELSITENVFMGNEPSRFGFIKWNEASRRTRALLQQFGLSHIDPQEKIKNLGIGEQQIVEIAKGLSQNPSILVLDEPTSALNFREVEILLRTLRSLKGQGISSILISHKLNEVLDVADEVTVLRDGKTVSHFPRSEATEHRIIADMVGRELGEPYCRKRRTLGFQVFEARGVTLPHPDRPGQFLLKNVSLAVKKSEILGIFGLMGAGRSELLMSLFGHYPPSKFSKQPYLTMRDSGTMKEGQISLRSPTDAIAAGLAFLSEDRKRFGLILEDSVLQNMSLAALSRLTKLGVINKSREFRSAEIYAKSLRIKMANLATPIKNLSGGNQQKVLFARNLMTEPRVLMLDEPTRGIDVGAKAEIYQLIEQLAEKGMGIILVSSELPEILGICDRILVMRSGEIVDEVDGWTATQEQIMRAATGVGLEGGKSASSVEGVQALASGLTKKLSPKKKAERGTKR